MKNLSRTAKSIVFMVIGLVINLSLAIVKFYVGYASGSLTIVMDSINNFLDLAFNSVAVIAFIIVLRKPNKEMPFGYGRAEYVASFLLSLFIIGSGGYFLIRSLQNIMIPVNLVFRWVYIVLLIVSILVKIGMGLLLSWANKEIRSNVFKGVILDSFIDSIITFLALLGFVLSKYMITLDSIFGIIISLIFIGFGIKILVDNFLVVLGKENFELSQKELLKSSILECCAVKEIRELVYHDYGFGKIIAIAKVALNENKDIEITNDENVIGEQLLEDTESTGNYKCLNVFEEISKLKLELEKKFKIELIFDIFGD